MAMALSMKQPVTTHRSQRSGHSEQWSRGFSLLELLVVISIMGLLVSILAPALAQSRGHAQATVCGSNIRQIATANGMYASDHDDCFCPGAADFMMSNLHRWHGTREFPSHPFDGSQGPLVPYMGASADIRACPALRIDLPEDDPTRFEKNCGGYGYNLAFVGRQLKRIGAGYRVATDLLGAKTSRIRDSAKTVMFTDTAFVSENQLIEYSFAEPRFSPTWGMRADPSIHFRHLRKASVAWCDGHVDTQRMTYTWSSGLYIGDPNDHNIGWFGKYDDNSYFKTN